MAHLPWAMTVGNAADMRKTADDLDRIGQNIASIFREPRAGGNQDWIDVLTNETWWSAQEAVDAKIADRVLPGTRKNGSASAVRPLGVRPPAVPTLRLRPRRSHSAASPRPWTPHSTR